MTLRARHGTSAAVVLAVASAIACDSRSPSPPSAVRETPSSSASARAEPSSKPQDPPAAESPPAAPARASHLVVVAGGDVNLGRGVGKRLLMDLEYDPFRHVQSWLSSADLVFVNLESPLADHNGRPFGPRGENVFAGPPVGAGILSRSGVGVVSVANNHSWDFGKNGFLQTLDSLKNAGVQYAGGSAEPGGQYAPRVLIVKGFKVAVFAVTDVWNYGPFAHHEGDRYVAGVDWERLEPEIVRARSENDIVLVSYHGGKEYVEEPTADTIAFARRAVKLGVDAVIGHHPHVAQGVAWLKGKPVFYSLGNLVFGVMRDYPATSWSFLAKLDFDGHGGVTARACIYRASVADLPEPASDPERTARAADIAVLSSRVGGGTRVGDADADGCVLLEPRH
jgi:poly-gamma-glutamate synthesis protein (capsule biosynthesis protein)